MDVIRQFNEQLQQKLDERKAVGLYRSLVIMDGKVDFSSNDYLGFSRLPELKAIDSKSLPAGATGSRLITGNSKLAEETENIIAEYHDAEAALIFNSGYDANTGLLSSIASKSDIIITDEYIHASLIDGARLSHATRYKFKHNDVSDLEEKLRQATGNKFVVIESVYSMDGDEAPLKEIAALCRRYDALLVVDEAHATGVYGEKGEGLVCHYQLENKVFARVVTYGKAMGLHGAAVLGSAVLRNYLINQARSFIYTTALPPVTYLQLQKAYEILPSANRQELFQLIEYFKKASATLENISFTQSNSPIQGVILGNIFKAKSLADYLFAKGFFVKAILSPTVPVGKERLRICVHSYNTHEQIDQLISAIHQCSTVSV